MAERNFKLIDLSGQRFGRLTVVSRDPTRNHCWRCVCDCGVHKSIKGQNLREGRTRSCGCLNLQRMNERRRKHGMWGSKEYWAWALAKNRCTNSKNKGYRNYGGRGIRMSEDWSNSFDAFLRDMGECPAGLSLDRINNDGNYEKGNCRWATTKQQMRNTRVTAQISHDGKILSFAEWAELTGIPVNTLRSRYHLGKRPPELFSPVNSKYSPKHRSCG